MSELQIKICNLTSQLRRSLSLLKISLLFFSQCKVLLTLGRTRERNGQPKEICLTTNQIKKTIFFKTNRKYRISALGKTVLYP